MCVLYACRVVCVCVVFSNARCPLPQSGLSAIFGGEECVCTHVLAALSSGGVCGLASQAESAQLLLRGRIGLARLGGNNC